MPVPHPAQTRIAIEKNAKRKADAQALVDYFATNHPELLVKLRGECLEAANARGLTPEAVVADAWRHLISRLRFLDPRKDGSAAP